MATLENNLLEGLNIAPADVEALPLVTNMDESVFLKQQLLADSQKSKFFTSLGSAIQEEWVLPTVINNIDRITAPSGEPIDKFTPELVRDLTEGLEDSRAVREVLEDAQVNGYSSAKLAQQSFLRTQNNLKQINQDGWSGVTATALAVMFDPVEWAAIFGTSATVGALGTPVAGVGAFLVGAGKQGRNAYRTAKVAALGGAELAAFESIRAKYRYDIEAHDVMIAAGIGAGLSGGLDAATTAFIRAGHRSRIAAKVARGEELTPNERLFHDQYNVDALATKLIDRELQGTELIDAVDGIPTIASRKAATEATAEEVAAIPKIAGFNMFGLRNIISSGARAANSELGRIRYAARLLSQNSAGYKGGKLETNNQSASEVAERLQLKYRSRMSEILPNAQALWKKRTNLSVAEFNAALSRYVRGIDTDVAPEVKKAGEAVKRLQREIAEEAVAEDVVGFSVDMLNANKNYMTRLFNDDQIAAIRVRLGDDADDQIAMLVEKAIREGQPNIEENVKNWLIKRSNGRRKGTPKQVADYIKRISMAYTKSITDPKLGKMGHAGANEMNLQDLADILRAGGFGEDEIDDLTEVLTRTNIPKAHKRARNRMVLNEGARMPLRNADGSIEEYSFNDLLEQDAEQLFNSYVFQLSGAIGLARNGINTNAANSSWESLVKQINDDIRAAPALDKEKLKGELDALEFIYDGITGRLPQREDISNRTRDLNVGFRAYSFAVNMGMSGMSALMELTNVLFESSFKTILKSAPEYNNLLTKMSKGKLDENDPLMVELIDAFGLGEEVALGKWNNVTRYDMDDVGVTISPERAWADKKGFGARAMQAGQSLQKTVAYWSGLTSVTQVLRRMSMHHYVNEWALKSADGKLPFSVTKRQQLGLSEDMARNIQTIMRSKIVEKRPNGTIKRLNLKQWPKQVRDAFEASGFKDARQNVQEANIGSTNAFMRSEFGRTFFQFLSFTMASMEQQGQRLGVRLARGDMTAAKILTSAAMMGGLMYAARVQLNAQGRSDADEYIRDNLSPSRWASGALSQIGAASLFSYLLQVTTGAMNGNTYAITPPAFSIAQSMMQSGKNVWEGDLTETEYRTLLRILPLQSLYGARQILNGVANEFAN